MIRTAGRFRPAMWCWYLEAQASWANDYYKQPGSDDIGSLYDRYTLMLYVDDGYKNFDLYGAKAKNANSIHWNK